MKVYPTRVCDDCGQKYGTWFSTGSYTGPVSHYATYHNGTCDICNAQDTPVTEPRDFGHILDWDVIRKQIASENNASKKRRKTRQENTD